MVMFGTAQTQRQRYGDYLHKGDDQHKNEDYTSLCMYFQLRISLWRNQRYGNVMMGLTHFSPPLEGTVIFPTGSAVTFTGSHFPTGQILSI